jgi:membrane-associated phospholipid phosphatase
MTCDSPTCESLTGGWSWWRAMAAITGWSRPGTGSALGVILRGQAAAHGLSFPSGHAMVILAITALVYPYLEGWRKALRRFLSVQ